MPETTDTPPADMLYAIGQRVRTAHSFSSLPRRAKVASYRLSSMGVWIYILDDGGWFFECELDAI
jgi:hypothetical protein